eukprot:7871270-Ditylum_brightwellii.AAC.1
MMGTSMTVSVCPLHKLRTQRSPRRLSSLSFKVELTVTDELEALLLAWPSQLLMQGSLQMVKREYACEPTQASDDQATYLALESVNQRELFPASITMFGKVRQGTLVPEQETVTEFLIAQATSGDIGKVTASSIAS